MILDLVQIKTIINENPGKDRIAKGVEYSKKLRRHIYGEGMDTYFQSIEGFERNSLKELRVKYSKSNKDLFSRLGRPLDKIFTARGGSVYYNLSDETEKKARLLTQDVKDGFSVRKWVECFWKPHILDDPFGVIFLELASNKEAVKLKQQGKSFVYPTYKSIAGIYDYLPKGNRLEYIVFTVSAEEKKSAGVDVSKIIYRVVDDAFDYWVEKSGEDVAILTNHTYTNYFGEVPAMVNSDIQNPQYENCFLSPYDEIIELAEQFLLKGSIRVTHDFMHGFPKYSEFASDCNNCNGTGRKEAKECDVCNGSGKNVMTRVSDVKMLSWPTKEDPLIMPAQVGGYISPDKTYYEIATADLQALEDAMSVTLWGSQSRLKTQGMSLTPDAAKTATEVMDEIKPQADRLVPVSEMAEQRDKFIRDNIIRLQISMNYQGSSVNYGRRYMLEGPDVIWQKYSDARAKGAPQNVLDTLLNEYQEANYQSDPVGLAIAKKLMYVEPFVHYTASVLKGLSPDPVDYKMKLYFSEWLATQNESAIISQSVDELKASLSEYAKAKNLPETQPVAA